MISLPPELNQTKPRTWDMQKNFCLRLDHENILTKRLLRVLKFKRLQELQKSDINEKESEADMI